MKSKVQFSLIWLLVICMVVILLPGTALAAYSDVQDHWAQPAIEKWSDLEIIQGSNGTFRPDDPITRGEMAVIINRVMQYQTANQNNFADLDDAFYTDAILKANAAGVIEGNGTEVRPTDKITREEATVMLGRALGLSESTTASTLFSDNQSISSWAAGYVNVMVNKGYIQGNNGAFRPQDSITRSEIVTILNNAIKSLNNEAKEYTGDVAGSVIVNTDGVIIKNMEIKGDLIISEGVENGDVTLNNVKVLGNTIVRGGGANSIHIQGNSELGNIIIEKSDTGAVRVVTSDGAIVDAVIVDDGKDDVILTGSFKNITVAADTNVKLVDAEIEKLEVTTNGASIDVDTNTNIDNMVINADVTVNNEGTITSVLVNVNGVTFDGNEPENLDIASTVTEPPTDSDGNEVSCDDSSGSSGGGGSTNLTTPDAPAVTAEDTTNAITGLDTTMEFKVDTAEYVKYDGSNAPDLAGIHTVLVRVAAVAGVSNASAATTLNFTFANAAPAAPAVTAEDTTNVITGLDTTMEFKVDAADYVKYNGSNAPDLTGEHTVLVRVAEDLTTDTPAGSTTSLTFTTN